MTKLMALFYLSIIGMFTSFGILKPEKTELITKVSMCYGAPAAIETYSSVFPAAPTITSAAPGIVLDSTKAYSMPLLAKTPAGEVMVSWTEKDAQGVTSFCLAFSKDNGKTFAEKKTIYSGTGIGNSRLMRAKVLTKKDGSLVAVFSNRAEAPAAGGNQPRRGGRSSDLVYCVSTDKGATWTSPQSVDSDPTKGIVRGFFDAVLLANDEVAVAYLKDVANSTKFEERDLRMVITKNGVFQPEKVIDPVVCDCCNISLLVDASGALTVYYRDNNDNIRDIAKMVSTDNAQTFGPSQIVYSDQWKINGCPHNGAASAAYGKSALVAWYSGAETETGIRLVNNEGKKLCVLNDRSAKNAFVTGGSNTGVLLWEQDQSGSNQSHIGFRKVSNGLISETAWVQGSDNGANATGLVLGKELLVAYEVKQVNGRNAFKVGNVSL